MGLKRPIQVQEVMKNDKKKKKKKSSAEMTGASLQILQNVAFDQGLHHLLLIQQF